MRENGKHNSGKRGVRWSWERLVQPDFRTLLLIKNTQVYDTK